MTTNDTDLPEALQDAFFLDLAISQFFGGSRTKHSIAVAFTTTFPEFS
jgi:hypothetical protein